MRFKIFQMFTVRKNEFDDKINASDIINYITSANVWLNIYSKFTIIIIINIIDEMDMVSKYTVIPYDTPTTNPLNPATHA